jgi:hypothetical protein
MATATALSLEDLTLTVTEEIHVRASLELTFEALLEQLSSENTTPEGNSLAMKIEPWPGGRWYRDLGSDNGHFWAVVQAIKRPTLLELNGPLFMSYPAVNNLQYRLSEADGGTLIKFRHTAMGLIPEDHRTGVGAGWASMHRLAKQRAERSRG